MRCLEAEAAAAGHRRCGNDKEIELGFLFLGFYLCRIYTTYRLQCKIFHLELIVSVVTKGKERRKIKSNTETFIKFQDCVCYFCHGSRIKDLHHTFWG